MGGYEGMGGVGRVCWCGGGRTAATALIYISIQPRWNIKIVALATFPPSIITYITDKDLIVLFILLTNQRKSFDRKRSQFGFDKQNLQLWIYQRCENVFTPLGPLITIGPVPILSMCFANVHEGFGAGVRAARAFQEVQRSKC